ncbi:unnamed protein product [Rotaria sp. Silwood2]|nr:unnamed protein product [Rotaria sp. Silwood2]CAF2864631.1 unnamed protein product [Rotaria sp. Silwood2]CAF4487899.1 unnamed protein product [Rotaria sp. Silwood2]CAF4551694.1 unnamed protein product [Rotaria sp. Silwood2]
MGQKKSRHLTTPQLEEAVIRRITRATSFLPDEIQYFYYDFLKYTPTGYLTLGDFEKFYQTLFRNGDSEKFAQYAFNAYDTNHDDIVDFEEFIKGLYYTTKASANEKIRWAFDLCDQDSDHQLDTTELENIIQALYELSDADMARIETYDEAITRVKQLLLTHQDNNTNTELLDSVTKSEFINIVQSDKTIMKLIDCQSSLNKRASKIENSTNLFKKQLKFKSPRSKSLSDPTLAAKKSN